MTKELAEMLAHRMQLTQIDKKTLAQRSGVSVSHIQQLCCGKGNAGYATATRIARVLKIPDESLPTFRKCATGKPSKKHT